MSVGVHRAEKLLEGIGIVGQSREHVCTRDPSRRQVGRLDVAVAGIKNHRVSSVKLQLMQKLLEILAVDLLMATSVRAHDTNVVVVRLEKLPGDRVEIHVELRLCQSFTDTRRKIGINSCSLGGRAVVFVGINEQNHLVDENVENDGEVDCQRRLATATLAVEDGDHLMIDGSILQQFCHNHPMLFDELLLGNFPLFVSSHTCFGQRDASSDVLLA